MATNFKVNVDLSQPRSEIEALKKAFGNLKLGENIGKGITEEIKKIEDKLQKMSTQKIDIKSSPEAIKAYVQGYKELEAMQKSINQQVEKELALKLQAKGLTTDDLRKMIERSEHNKNSLNLKQQELTIAKEISSQTAKEIGNIDKKLESAKQALIVSENYLKTLKDPDAIKKQEEVVEKRKAAYAELLGYQKRYEQQEKTIEGIKREILKLETDVQIGEGKLQFYGVEIQLTKEIEQALKKNIEARKEDIKIAQDKTKVIEQEHQATVASQTKVSAGVENLINKMKRLAEFTIAAFAVRYIRQFVTQGLRFIEQLDKALTEIATVTGKTREEMWLMAEEFNRMGRELGKTTVEITQASVIFYRQGLNTNEVLAMVRASTISAAIANTDAAEASNRLTAALRGYNMEATEAMSVADKIAALAAKSASSFDELSYAMTKTASSAAVAGIDIDHLYAYLAKVIETTREAPENIGTAFKTIIARIAQVKESAEEMEDAFDLNKAAEALRSVGISITDVNGQIIDMQEIFGALGNIWDKLDRNTKAYMATVLAGSRQQSRFLALMNDWNRTTELITISQHSAGEASRQFQTHLTGLEASMVRLTAAKEEFLMNLIDSNTYKAVIDGLRSMFDVFSGLHPIIVLTIGALTLYSTKMIIAAAASAVKTRATASGTIELFKYNAGLAIGATSEYTFAKGVAYSTLMLKSKIAVIGGALTLMVPYLLLLGAIAGAIALIAYKSSEAKRDIESMQEQIGKERESATVLERQVDTLEKLVGEQEDLKNKVSLTREETNRLKTINQELIDTYGDLEWRLDSLGNVVFPNLTESIKKQRDEIDRLNLSALEIEKTLALMEAQNVTKDSKKQAGTDWWSSFLSGGGEGSIIENYFARRKLIKHYTEKLGMDEKEATIKAWEEQRKTLESNWEQRTTYEQQLITNSRNNIIETLKMAESEKFNVINDFQLQGITAVNDFINNFYKAYSDGIDVSALTEIDFESFVNQFNQDLMTALDSWQFNEEHFANTVKNFNEAFLYSLESGGSVEQFQGVFDKYFEFFEKAGLSVDYAFSQIQDGTIYEIAQAIHKLGNEAEYITNKFHDMSSVSFVDLLNYIDDMGWSLPEKKEIDELLEAFNNFAQMPGFTEKLQEMQSYLDAGHLSLYNQGLRELAETYEISKEELNLLLEVHGKHIENLDSEEQVLINVLNAQKGYTENVKELLEYKKRIIEGNGLEVEQMLKLIEVHGITAEQFDVVNGLLTVKADIIDDLIAKEGEHLDASILNEQARIEVMRTRLEAEKELIIAMLAIYEAEGEGSAELAKYLLAIEKLKLDAKITSAEGALKATEEVVNTEIDAAGEITDTAEKKEADLDQMSLTGVRNRSRHLQKSEEANQTFLQGVVDDTETAVEDTKSFWENLKDFFVDLFKNLVISWKLIGDLFSGSLDFSASGGNADQSGGDARNLKKPRDYNVDDTGTPVTSKFDKGFWEAKLNSIDEALKALDKLSANLGEYSLDALKKAIEGIGSAGKEAEKAVKDVEKALKDTAKQIDEYKSKLDMWYNVLRQILILEQDLAKLKKETQLMSSESDLLQALETELLLLRQIEAQQVQRQSLIQDELQKTAILLMTAAGSAVTLSDDLKHLHVNQDEFLKLSTGQKQIVDDLIQSFDELSKSLNNAEIAALDAAIAIRQIQLQSADALIKAIQDALRKQQKLVIAAIDYEMKRHKEAHDAKMKMYDQELQSVIKIIDAKIKSIDEQATEEDFIDDLTQAKNEELRLREEINKLALDDSFEARAKEADLQKQLADQVSKIEKMQKDYTRNLRKKELQELKQQYQNETAEKKSQAEEQLKILQDQLQDAKDAINYHYQEMFNNEVYWAQMREEILAGNLANVEAMVQELGNFFGDVSSGIHDIAQQYGIELTYLTDAFGDNVELMMQDLGVSYQAVQSIISAVTTSMQRTQTATAALTKEINAMTASVLNQISSINKAKSTGGGSSGGSSGGSGSTSGGTTGTMTHNVSTNISGMSKAWQDGYAAGKKAVQRYNTDPRPLNSPFHQRLALAKASGYILGGSKHGPGTSADWYGGYDKGVADAQKSQTTTKNTTTTTSNTTTSSGTSNPWWKLFHDGGIVEGSRNQYHGANNSILGGKNKGISKLINDLFQVQNNEVVAKLLEGEVVVNPATSIENLRANLKGFIENMQQTSGEKTSSTTPSPAQSRGAGTISVYIDNMVADNKEHVRRVFTEIQRELNKVGAD